MLRIFLIGAIRCINRAKGCLLDTSSRLNLINSTHNSIGDKRFSSVFISSFFHQPKLLSHPEINKLADNIQKRTVTKFSLKKGKRKSVKAVLKRFYRLDWGGWIRTRAGRHKHMWRKSSALKRRLRQHVFVNATQSTLLDKMVTKCWKRPKYYIDDPYSPYHTREEFIHTRKKPLQK